jgi:hypothetical protein
MRFIVIDGMDDLVGDVAHEEDAKALAEKYCGYYWTILTPVEAMKAARLREAVTDCEQGSDQDPDSGTYA